MPVQGAYASYCGGSPHPTPFCTMPNPRTTPNNPWLFRTEIFFLVGIIIGAFGIYATGFSNQLTNWDDTAYLTDNYFIRDFSWKGIKELFTSFYIGNYHPLTMLSYMIEYHFVELNPRLYIVNNVIIHLCNVAAVWWLCRLWKLAAWTPLTVAALFALHPMRAESVIWISERKDVLYGLFFLLAMICHTKYRSTPSWSLYILTLLCFLASLLSKAMAMTFPAVVLLIDWRLHGKLSRRALIESFPYWIFAIAFAVVAIVAQGSAGAVNETQIQEWFVRPMLAAHGIVFYVEKLFLPIGLSPIYPLPVLYNTPFPPRFYWAAPILICGGVLVWLWRREKDLLWGTLFFLVTVAPVLQLVSVGQAFAADRYTYIPFLGLFLPLGGLASRALGNPQQLMRSAAALCIISISVAMGILTVGRVGVYKNGETLWTDAIAKYPELSLAWSNRGHHFMVSGQYDRALPDLDTAIKFNPKWKFAYANRGVIRLKRNNIDDAFTDFSRALEIDPRFAMALNNRAYIFILRAEWAAAKIDLDLAISVKSRTVEAYRNRGMVYEHLGDFDAARRDYEEVLRLAPNSTESFFALGVIAEKEGNVEVAINHFSRFIKESENPRDGLLYRGSIYLASARFMEAEADFQRAVSLNPKDSEALSNLATTFMESGNLPQALVLYNKAIEESATRATLFLNRSIVRERLGDVDGTLSDLATAARLAPDSAQIHSQRTIFLAARGLYPDGLLAAEAWVKADPASSQALQYRAVMLGVARDFVGAWRDVLRLEALGQPIDPAFLQSLEQAMPRPRNPN